MSLVLVASILIRIVALVWSILLLRRLRDWRMAFLSVMLLLMGTRQMLTLIRDREDWSVHLGGHLVELPGLVVSIMAFLTIFFLERFLSEHRRNEQQLERHRSQLRALVYEMSLAEERERQRIAQGLHDQSLQRLALLKIKLGTLQQMCATVDNVDSFEELRSLVNTAIAETRSMSFDLSPPVLHEQGLDAALDWLVARMQADYGLRARFHTDRSSSDLPKDTQIAVFSILRELLINVSKHAQARTVDVTAMLNEENIMFRVQDDGLGFDPRPTSTSEPSGYGLFSVRERVTRLGGSVEIDAAIGRGSCVTILLPLRNGASGSALAAAAVSPSHGP